MKIVLPPPLETPPASQSFLQDFRLLLKNQMRVYWNKWRHRPKKTLILTALFGLFLLFFVTSLGYLVFGALESIPHDIVQGFLGLLFMGGLVAQIFFGITAAFAALYMSEDLELLFMAPVSIKAVFAVKSLSVVFNNLVTAVFFVLLPGVFYGLLFQAGGFFYFIVVLVTLGLLTIGTAVAELLNLVVMRIVPPHRSKEAIGFIGALAGIMIALLFQIPNLMMANEDQFNLGDWLSGNSQIIDFMNFFPWGWGSKALVAAMSGDILIGLVWSIAIFVLGAVLFALAFRFVERGFRRGFISLSQGEGGRRRKKKHRSNEPSEESPLATGTVRGSLSPIKQIWASAPGQESALRGSALTGMWAVAKKDLLYLKRDSREWFGYLTPLIIMVFFVAQYLFIGSEGTRASLVIVLFMYTIMFSGNMALQSFGREGESDWLLNSVPFSGWPVVYGKLLASVLPTLVLMEALLVGTGIAISLSPSWIIAFAIGAIFLSLGSSAIGLFYSINNSRYNPESPQQRISPGASLVMYLINMVFIGVLAIGIIYLFRPAELIAIIEQLPPVTFEWGIISVISYVLYLLSRPLVWPTWAGMLMGLVVTLGVWSVMFFGFMAATVHQSRKGFRVEIVTSKKKTSPKLNHKMLKSKR